MTRTPFYPKKVDYLILGAGVVGLSVGIALLKSNFGKKVLIVEKESKLAMHASGRNSGVLHAGFYYSPNSLKAKFCRDGNKELRALAGRHDIPICEVGKVVVARNENENIQLDTLFSRGLENGVELELLADSQLKNFEPLAIAHERFIWSPTTAVSDPVAIIDVMRKDFESFGGEIHYNTKISLEVEGNEVRENSYRYDARYIINAAGAQADRISRSVNVGLEYAMLPFMGIYRATEQKNLPLKRLVYPVPHSINPFLGVHFTLTYDKKVKIGPTAIPVFGREQYSLSSGWSSSDITQSLRAITSLIKGNVHDFSAILRTESRNTIQKFLIKEAVAIVPSADLVSHWSKKPPGIRAQLVHIPTGKLEQDFVVQTKLNATHILNAVSPGWTSAIPFGRWVTMNI